MKMRPIDVLNNLKGHVLWPQSYHLSEAEAEVCIKALEQEPCEDCRNCKKWNKCPCGKEGHENGTSIGYSIGECKDYEPCEITAEEYRQRMIQAFHNADTDELIAVCVLPTEKEFEHLEWLLKNHYKQKPKTGHWISDAIQGEIDGQIVKAFICSECGAISVFRTIDGKIVNGDLCPNCGAKMESEG